LCKTSGNLWVVLPLTQRIRKAVAAHRAEMAEFTRELVRIRTAAKFSALHPPGKRSATQALHFSASEMGR
jgi:hypothetical protein